MIARILEAIQPAGGAVRGRRSRGLRFEPLESRSMLAPLADIVNVTPDPRTTPVGQVFIDFTDSLTGLSSPVTGVDINDFTLTRNGTAVSLAGLSVIGSGDAYSLDLTSVAFQDGNYLLTLVASGSIP